VIVLFERTSKDKAVPLHATKLYRRTRDKAPIIFNLGTRSDQLYSPTALPVEKRASGKH